MTLTRMFDAAVPPDVAPGGCSAVLGYTGRPGFTPHVWTAAEWNRFEHLRMLPAWVPNLSNPPGEEAVAACDAAAALGWERGWNGALPPTETRAIVFDFELTGTQAAREWWAACSDDIHSGGFVGVAYGSESTVFELAASWVFLAAWDGFPALGEGQTVVAHQYNDDVLQGDGAKVDFSVMSPWLYARCGRGPRR